MHQEDRKPMMLVFAGPNGSGKSTIQQYLELVGSYTNADDIVKSTGMSNEEAAKYVDNKRYESIEKKEDLTFETVLSSEYKINILKKAKEEGYFIKCIYVLTNDPQINIDRVEMRVDLGGHGVSEDKIRERYVKSLNNIKVLMNLCDILHVYDNSGEAWIRIIRKHKNEISIFPCEYWKEDEILKLILEDN